MNVFILIGAFLVGLHAFGVDLDEVNFLYLGIASAFLGWAIGWSVGWPGGTIVRREP